MPAVKHAHILVDPAKHPLLYRWITTQRWLWQPLLRDLAEQCLRDGTLPAEVPFVRKRRPRAASEPPQATPAVVGSVTPGVAPVAAALPQPSPADVAAPDDPMEIARAAMMRNVF